MCLTLGRAVLDAARAAGHIDVLETFGATLITDTCWWGPTRYLHALAHCKAAAHTPYHRAGASCASQSCPPPRAH